MLGRSRVEPVHLLLAFARRCRFKDLLGELGVSTGALHAAVLAGDGMGDELVLGRLPLSPASEKVLQRAVGVAAERGERRPGSVHVLLALIEDDDVQAILRDLDLDDLVRLVDEHDPPRAPRSDEQARADLVRAALQEQTQPARPPVPAFERFTRRSTPGTCCSNPAKSGRLTLGGKRRRDCPVFEKGERAQTGLRAQHSLTVGGERMERLLTYAISRRS